MRVIHQAVTGFVSPLPLDETGESLSRGFHVGDDTGVGR
jgi:hypothetical protein